MQVVEAEGENIDAAIAAALSKLGVPREQVTLDILSEGSRGIFGIGGRKARVRAAIRPPVDAEPVELETKARRSDAVAPAPRPAAEAPRGEDRARDERPEHAPAPLDDATVERARDVLASILKLAGFEANVVASNDGDHATLEIVDDASGLIIGRKGQTLDALEYIISRVLSRDEERSVHVTVDSQGYRSRRQAALEDLARRMAQEAKRRRKPVHMEDLNPRERRIVHMVLRQDTSLRTRSSGEGHLRTLLIIPNGAGPRRRADD